MRNGRAKRDIFRETKREKEENIYISTTAEETARPVQLEREREGGGIEINANRFRWKP